MPIIKRPIRLDTGDGYFDISIDVAEKWMISIREQLEALKTKGEA